MIRDENEKKIVNSILKTREQKKKSMNIDNQVLDENDLIWIILCITLLHIDIQI